VLICSINCEGEGEGGGEVKFDVKLKMKRIEREGEDEETWKESINTFLRKARRGVEDGIEMGLKWKRM
jgi:hypothetical protein